MKQLLVTAEDGNIAFAGLELVFLFGMFKRGRKGEMQ